MEKPVLNKELKSETVVINQPAVSCDGMNDFKQYAIDLKKYYEDLVYTDEQVKEAKEERASVNKLIKRVANHRKTVVENFNKPIEDFVTTAKEVENLLKEASSCIDVQVKKYEDEERQAKGDSCAKLYENLIGDLKDLVTFDSIFDPKWLNKTTKLSEVESDIKSIIEKVQSGLKAIKSLNSEYETELISTFLEDYDITEAIAKDAQLKAQAESIKKTENAKEESKQEEIKEMISTPVEEVEEERDIMKSYTLRITANYTKMTALKHFMDLNEIEYEKVEI